MTDPSTFHCEQCGKTEPMRLPSGWTIGTKIACDTCSSRHQNRLEELENAQQALVWRTSHTFACDRYRLDLSYRGTTACNCGLQEALQGIRKLIAEEKRHEQ